MGNQPSEAPLERTTTTPPMSIFREAIFVAMVCSAQLITQACLAQSITPLHIIGNSFSITSPSYLSWMPAAYSLTVGTFILPSGRLGDLFGHKKMFVAGYLWLALWSLIAGVSVYSGQILFDVCRAFQGIGPALLLPNAIAILGRTYPPGRRKDMVFSIFGSTAPGGFLIGALFSALLGQLAWWPWAYFATAIAAACLAAGSMLVLPSIPVLKDDANTSVSLTQKMDLWGILMGVTGLVLVNFAWNQGPLVGWPTVYVYVLLIVGFVFVGVFFVVETRVPCPLLPLHAFSRETGFVLGCIATGWSSFGIWLYYLWQFMEVLRHQTPLQSTAYFVPVAISGLCAALTTGKLLSFMRPSWVMLISMTAFTVGTIVLATCPVRRVYWAGIFISCIIMPWGMDMSFPSGCIILSNNMSKEHQGVAASLVNTAVNYSISIGLGMAGTVESQVNNGGLDVLKGYRGAWYLGIGLGALGMGTSLCFLLFGSKRESNEQGEKGGGNEQQFRGRKEEI
jgi:MFS family permease